MITSGWTVSSVLAVFLPAAGLFLRRAFRLLPEVRAGVGIFAGVLSMSESPCDASSQYINYALTRGGDQAGNWRLDQCENRSASAADATLAVAAVQVLPRMRLSLNGRFVSDDHIVAKGAWFSVV